MAEKVLSNPHIGTNDTIEISNKEHKDGGMEAWLTVFGSFLIYYASVGMINSFGFFQNYYQTEYLANVSPTTISVIGTLQLSLMSVLSTVSGGICDSHGIKVSEITSV